MIYHCENSDQVLRNVHEEVDCHGSCPIHRRSNHHMRSFPQHWRHDRQIMERICPHGVGHPDPDDPHLDTVHGCDGCCAPKFKFRMLDLELEDRCAARRQYRTLRIAIYAPSSYTEGMIPHYQGCYGLERDDAKQFLSEFYERVSWAAYIGSK